jgi:Concanavalin A-like lectin/glucanases superfamily
MKSLQLSRREMLGGLLAVPVVSLTGCSSGALGYSWVNVPGSAVPAAGPTTDAGAGAVKPVLVYFQYSGDELESVEQNLQTAPDHVTTTADRFAQGALCYEFDGSGSSVTVGGISPFPTGDFALLLWVNTSVQSIMPVLRIVGTDQTEMVIEVNGLNRLLTVSWNGRTVASVPVVNDVQTVGDGAWHHITVQRYESSLQLFLDGVAVGVASVSQALPSNPTVVVGEGWYGAIDGVRLYNRAFPAQSIPQCVYQWTEVKPSTAPATNNLLAYFPFFGNAQNYLGYGTEGVVQNATLTTDRYGSNAAAYLFNGVNACISLTVGFESTAGDFALAFWAQSSVAAQMTALSASSGGIDGTSLDVVFNDGTALQVYLDGMPVPALSVGTSGEFTDGNWHFILLQRVGTALQLYVDGTLAATTTSEAIFFGSTSVMQFGCGSGASAAVGHYWNGKLDDVQIYAISLTAANIAALLTLEYLGRDGVGALSFQGKMWLLGGWNPNFVPDTNSEVWSSADGLNWTLVTIAPWQRRHDAGYAVFDNKMWIVGGDKETGHYQNDVWCSGDGVNWQQVTDTVPWANRATQYVLAFADRLWLMGGQQIFETQVPPVVAFNDVYSSVDGANWQQATPAAPWSPRGMILGNVVFQGRMWVIGGGLYDIRTFNNDVWSSPDGVHWTLVLAQAPWSPRQFQNIVVFDSKIWVLAGGDPQSQGGLNDVWYSTDGVIWTQLGATPWPVRHAATTIVHDGYLYLTGGTYAFANDDVWKMGYAP